MSSKFDEILDKPISKAIINATIAISGTLFHNGCEKCNCEQFRQDRTGRQQEKGVMPYCFCGHNIEFHKGLFS